MSEVLRSVSLPLLPVTQALDCVDWLKKPRNARHPSRPHRAHSPVGKVENSQIKSVIAIEMTLPA